MSAGSDEFDDPSQLNDTNKINEMAEFLFMSFDPLRKDTLALVRGCPTASARLEAVESLARRVSWMQKVIAHARKTIENEQ